MELAEILGSHGVSLEIDSSESPAGLDLDSFAFGFVDVRHFRDFAAIGNQCGFVILAEDLGRDDIVVAMRFGARDFLQLPLNTKDTTSAIQRALAVHPGPVAKLSYVDANAERQELPLHEGANLSIGREQRNELVFDSQVVSRFHARLLESDGEFYIIDQHSRHGTWINDESTEGRTRVYDGDRIRLGKPSAPEVVFLSGAQGGDSRETPTSASPASSSQLKDVAALLDTLLQLNEELVLDDVLALVLSRSIEFAEAERGLILLTRDEEGHSVGVVPSKSPPQYSLKPALARQSNGRELDPDQLTISQRIPKEVLETGKGVLLADLLSEERADMHLNTIDLGVRSAVCVPLTAIVPGAGSDQERASIGVLYLDSSGRSRPFSESLLHAVESLANEAAQAITNAELYRISQQKRQIDEEMKIARAIQSNLLPAGTFENSLCELRASSTPSREVGGDFFNYFTLSANTEPDKRMGVLVGDVSGKGISAAIFAALLDGHFLGMTSIDQPERELPRLCEELNRHLVARSDGQKFVSVFFAVLDREHQRLIYINAGHNPPLHVKPDGQMSTLSTGDTLMGLFDDATYRVGTTTLDSGDLLVLYSDGITEWKNPAGEIFGLDRLRNAVAQLEGQSAPEIYRGILDAVESFADNEPPGDDVTLLVTRMK